MQLPITACIITKNEEEGIGRSVIAAKKLCDQVLVIDSNSADRTRECAQEAGAQVVEFQWSGEYPKKKQWALAHSSVENDWVFLLDADEVISPQLADELRQKWKDGHNLEVTAFDIRLAYHFSGKRLRFGHRVVKRCLVDRRSTRFPEVQDLDAPGITEVEGHYQPLTDGAVSKPRGKMIHDDPDPLSSWVDRHNRYSDWEAHLRLQSRPRNLVRSSRSRQGQIFDRVPAKSAAFFLYSYILRLGFLDGRAGFDYAYALAFYYWLIEAKTREHRAPLHDGGDIVR